MGLCLHIQQTAILDGIIFDIFIYFLTRPYHHIVLWSVLGNPQSKTNFVSTNLVSMECSQATYLSLEFKKPSHSCKFIFPITDRLFTNDSTFNV